MMTQWDDIDEPQPMDLVDDDQDIILDYCSGCGQEIPEDLARCPSCGQWMPAAGSAEHRSRTWLWPAIIALCILAILMVWAGIRF